MWFNVSGWQTKACNETKIFGASLHVFCLHEEETARTVSAPLHLSLEFNFLHKYSVLLGVKSTRQCLLGLFHAFFPRLFWRIFGSISLSFPHSLLWIFREILFFGENAQFRYPQVYPVLLMSSLVLFSFFFSSDVLEGTNLVVPGSFDDSQLGAPTGGQPKKETKSSHWSVCAVFLCTSLLKPLSLLMFTEMNRLREDSWYFLKEKMANSINY